MKKFSKITKVDVNSEPKVQENETDTEIKTLRYAVHQLIKEFLHIRIYGPIDPILEGTLKIEGENDFIESVLDLFKTKEVGDTLKLLQEAKFNGLDNSIDRFERLVEEKQTQSMLIKHRRRIEDIMTKSQGNKEKAIKLATTQANRIKSGEKTFYRGLAAEGMIGKKDENDKSYPKATLQEIADLFFYKSKQLGYRK
ncbi:MAG: hypothetical protein SLAVMIC_00436 [uncultured marine phage]|uniref:Uncharacterized protein n=1 Tax=uncultured marine phage TaxID=707152 RepID=A0A8D9FS52_9VIRU|nr:MAG: hypothetical protein SLAVMIC_00436 [uncultured marine phage]